jgi:hypothetical protein
MHIGRILAFMQLFSCSYSLMIFPVDGIGLTAELAAA